MSYVEHLVVAPKQVLVAIVTISDTRTVETDKSGQYLKKVIQEKGHKLSSSLLITDSARAIKKTLAKLLKSEAQIIITTGGTGIAHRDNTVPIVKSFITQPIEGFGELFRMLSYKEIGGAAMLTRATAGVAKGKLIFALPGSLNAVKTAWEKLLESELSHLVYEVCK